MIAYRFQTLPDQQRFGVLVDKKTISPAIFFTPAEVKLTVVDSSARITIALIQTVVAEHYGVAPEHMRSRSHCRTHVYPRWMAMLLSRELTKSSLPEMGRRFGGRDHSTVIHGLRSVKKQIADDPKVEHDYDTLRAKFAA